MGTKKDFRVKTGLVVEDGDVTLASDHSVKAGIFDTNIAAAGVTLTGTTLAADGTDTNIDINITPKGSGEVNITKVDIGAGAIDGTIIGGASAVAGTFTTLTANDLLDVNAGATITGDTTDEITLDIQGVASQSVDALRIRDSDGNVDLNVSHAGVTTAASLVATTADINAGTVDNTTIGVTTPVAGNFTTIGATTQGTIAGTTIDATTDFTVGSTVIKDDLIVMTPSTDDTVRMEASGNGAFELTTEDTDAGDTNTGANIQISAGGQFRQYWMANEQMILGTTTYDDGNAGEITGQNLLSIKGDTSTGEGNASGGDLSPIANNVFDLGSDSKEYKNVWVDGLVTSGTGVHLGYGANSKLNTITTGAEVTGTLEASSTLIGSGFKSTAEATTAGSGAHIHSSSTIKITEDSGIYKTASVDSNFTSTKIEEANFRGSMMETDTDGNVSITFNSVVPLIFVNLNSGTENIYHSVDLHCAMQEKDVSSGGNTAKKWLSQNIKASYDGNTVQFQTSDSRWMNLDITGGYMPGEFCAQKWADSSDLYLVISYCPYYDQSSSNRTVTYAVNANGLSMPVSLSA